MLCNPEPQAKHRCDLSDRLSQTVSTSWSGHIFWHLGQSHWPELSTCGLRTAVLQATLSALGTKYIDLS